MSIIDDETRARQSKLIDAWLTDLRVRDRAESTIDLYSQTLRRAHRELSYGIAGSNTEELQAWIWTPGRAPATRKLYRAAVVSFFEWAVNNQHLDFDPARLLPSVRVTVGQPRPAPQEALADILAKAREPFRIWFLLAAAMGLRCVEISRLDREDITEERTWIQGKGGHNQYLPTHPVVWLAVRDLPPGPIARDGDGGRAARKSVYMRANMHIRRLGHPGITMHQLRHYHGTQIYRASGNDLMVAKAALRHGAVAMTQRYVATEDSALIAAQRAIPLPI